MSHCNSGGDFGRGACGGTSGCMCGCNDCSAERLARQPANAVELPAAGLVKMADRTPYGSHWCTQHLGCPGCIASALVPLPTPLERALQSKFAEPLSDSERRELTAMSRATVVAPMLAGQSWNGAPMNADDACRAVDALCSHPSTADQELSRLRDQHRRLECAMGDLRNENEELRKENEGLRREARARKAGRR